MSDIITSAGAIAGAVSAILALVVAILVKPILAWRKHRKDKEREQTEFRAELLAKLDAINDDIGDLQYERLSQAHDFYTGRGWCPTSKKDQLCTMYKSYTAKGRNHLSKFYEQEILALPDTPPKGDNT